MLDGAMSRKPNFFIVGAAKSGTTAMHDYLEKHPDIFMASKEPHYFATDLLGPKVRSLTLERYLALFAGARDEKVVGESSVFYLCSKVSAGRIKEFSPDAKILIHVRNPMDVIPSHHSQLIYEGGETTKNLRQALALEPRRKRGQAVNAEFYYGPDIFCYRDFVRFHEQITRFFDAFGRERVHIVVYDDFARDTACEYRKVLEFLEVDPRFRPEFPVVNANKIMRSKFLMDLVVRDPPAWAGTIGRTLFPIETRNAIKQWFKGVNTRYRRREPLDLELARELKRDLRPDVERLSVLLGRDLSRW